MMAELVAKSILPTDSRPPTDGDPSGSSGIEAGTAPERHDPDGTT